MGQRHYILYILANNVLKLPFRSEHQCDVRLVELGARAVREAVLRGPNVEVLNQSWKRPVYLLPMVGLFQWLYKYEGDHFIHRTFTLDYDCVVWQYAIENLTCHSDHRMIIGAFLLMLLLIIVSLIFRNIIFILAECMIIIWNCYYLRLSNLMILSFFSTL